MKKLLILAYDFPPYVSVGGLRPYSWYRYLKEFGVEPTLVTRQWENKYGNELDYISPSASKETIIEETEYGTIIKAPFFPSLANRLLLKHGKKKYKFLRKALTAIDEIRQYLYILTPKKQVYYSAKKYLKNNKVDAIIATGEPFVMFFYAKKLSQKYNIPWIADYRDPWSQNKARRINKFLIRINTYFETKISNTANCITTVSVFLKKTIEENVFDKTFHIIPNGYNPELIDETAKKTQSSKKLTISFIGTIYKWHPWQSFLNVFTKLATNNHNIKIDFYGINNVDEVKSYIASLPEKVQNQIKIYPKLQNKELMQKNANANVFLLFNDYSI
ncbi:MAG: glycosyltransferase family 4 protein, partial [Bacteroidales bacterium]|nr:glycosyltransferase family 4 protein [Bacteroidales bacterium]